jgi:hypothetical protein
MAWSATAQPTSICFSEKYPGTGSGNPSYFDVTIDTTAYDGWCLDGSKHIDTSGTYTANVLDLATANVPNMDKVLWVLNQHYPGKTSQGGSTFVFDDVQAAIWLLIGSPSGGGISNADATRVDEILAAADANGKGFVPGCDQISAEVLQVIAVGCPNGTLAELQPILIEIPVVCPKLACIGDFVWNDTNQDGKQDAGEPGMAGVMVELIDCATGAVVGTTTTDANGNYQFSDLTPGSYRIHVVAPAGYVFSPANTTTGDADSDADQNGLMPCTTLDAGECDLTWDAGLYMPPPPQYTCTLTPGFWMNHPNAWPVESITVGGFTYTKAQAIALIKAPTKGDVRYTMFAHLVSAMLNMDIGSNPTCILDTAANADAWWANYGANAVKSGNTWKLGGTPVPGGSAAWGNGAPLASMLDSYNNGLLCAPHCDTLPFSNGKATPLRAVKN